MSSDATVEVEIELDGDDDTGDIDDTAEAAEVRQEFTFLLWSEEGYTEVQMLATEHEFNLLFP